MNNLQEIISKCKVKDSKAEKVLFLRFAPRILTICRRYASHNVEAQDLMQECFIRLFNKIDQFDPNKGVFEGWLHRLCTNTILTIIKPVKRKITLVYPGELPEQELTKSEFEAIPGEVILAAIQKLPVGYRQIFNLYTFDHYTHKEIAHILGIAESTSRSQLTKARKMLRLILQKKIDDNYERKLA